ncbi:unnamed protein product [Bursaphelenchus xylophilus]|uniref:(pine wood nematode) hypothetical protein n=1 Tax=Bursaphelenchus xylophilus TaxID=6326 RepID=A0A1I7S7Y6_BURXY|nr:unnamed protein product [Bursaphelenchus xylophilus]CAG9087236.1 unnamed protein product [Bursaphelenchus xylophilus]
MPKPVSSITSSPAEIPNMELGLDWSLKEQYTTSDGVIVSIYSSKVDPKAILYNLKSNAYRVLLQRTSKSASVIVKNRSRNNSIHYLHAEL